MKFENINMLNDTMAILDRGYYEVNGKRVNLKLSKAEMKEISVFLPKDVKSISDNKDFQHIHMMGGRIGVDCVNMDSYSLAIKRYSDCSYLFSKKSKPILVLNLANPVNPGGGVRRGSKAQEEDLCRKSSLLLSLESSAASVYYKYNKSLNTYMGSDAVMVTPQVEIMPSSVVSHIISRILCSHDEMSLKDMVLEARGSVSKLFAEDKNLPVLVDIIDKAVRLSEKTDTDDLDNIHALGEGWVAEETLGIALYCALKYQNDFSKAMIVSVNHKGDSDSTGAVTGNILGALIGYDAIDSKWKKDLELLDVILEVADDLCHGCQMSEYSYYFDPAWATKYMHMHRYEEPKKNPEYVFFWLDNEKYGEFSNWYQREFVIDDFRYFCVEQYMMAQKAKLFHDSVRYTAILRANSPKDCKALGKQVTPFDAKVWDAVKYDIVKTGNKAKFEQNPDLMNLLLSTGDRIMAEASPKDKIWGIALDAETAKHINPEAWPGQNLLGKILMELKAEYRKEQSKSSATELRMIKGDITKQSDVEAIVNAANTSLLGGGGVDGAIHRAAGRQLLEECRKLNGCKTGEAKLTGAYKLPCKYIIHTVGPIWRGGNQDEEKFLAECYSNSLQIAVDQGIRSVAFPSISTGAYSFPKEKAAMIAVRTVNDFIEENSGSLDLVEWILFDEETLNIYKDALNQFKANKIVGTPK